MPARAEYSPANVRGLIEAYYSLREDRDTTRQGLNTLVEIADLDPVLADLPDGYWRVVFLHGMLGMPQRDVAEHLNTSQSRVQRLYQAALEEITTQINGGSP